MSERMSWRKNYSYSKKTIWSNSRDAITRALSMRPTACSTRLATDRTILSRQYGAREQRPA